MITRAVPLQECGRVPVQVPLAGRELVLSTGLGQTAGDPISNPFHPCVRVALHGPIVLAPERVVFHQVVYDRPSVELI
jgi:hypothetical protein